MLRPLSQQPSVQLEATHHPAALYTSYTTDTMKGLVGFTALSLVFGDAAAHYIFNQLSTGGTKHAVYKYIRENSNGNYPVTELSSPDLRCNVGANGARTETVSVRAGDSFTFHLDTPVYHQGPVSLYMSRAPGSVSDYDGSGGWFKIHDWGPSFTGGGASWVLSGSYTFSIPSCLADGEYLLRIQSLGIHNPWPAGIPQFYISCAQVRVSGGGSANPSGVSIPGAFKESDSGYTANVSFIPLHPRQWIRTDNFRSTTTSEATRCLARPSGLALPLAAVVTAVAPLSSPSPRPSPSRLLLWLHQHVRRQARPLRRGAAPPSGDSAAVLALTGARRARTGRRVIRSMTITHNVLREA